MRCCRLEKPYTLGLGPNRQMVKLPQGPLVRLQAMPGRLRKAARLQHKSGLCGFRWARLKARLLLHIRLQLRSVLPWWWQPASNITSLQLS